MADQSIAIYQGNSKNFTCDVSGGLSDLNGYIPTFTVKKNISDTTIILEKQGTIDELTITFNITYNDSSINAGNYFYDITIDNSINRYTVVQDKFIVKDSVRY